MKKAKATNKNHSYRRVVTDRTHSSGNRIAHAQQNDILRRLQTEHPDHFRTGGALARGYWPAGYAGEGTNEVSVFMLDHQIEPSEARPAFVMLALNGTIVRITQRQEDHEAIGRMAETLAEIIDYGQPEGREGFPREVQVETTAKARHLMNMELGTLRDEANGIVAVHKPQPQAPAATAAREWIADDSALPWNKRVALAEKRQEVLSDPGTPDKTIVYKLTDGAAKFFYYAKDPTRVAMVNGSLSEILDFRARPELGEMVLLAEGWEELGYRMPHTLIHYDIPPQEMREMIDIEKATLAAYAKAAAKRVKNGYDQGHVAKGELPSGTHFEFDRSARELHVNIPEHLSVHLRKNNGIAKIYVQHPPTVRIDLGMAADMAQCVETIMKTPDGRDLMQRYNAVSGHYSLLSRRLHNAAETAQDKLAIVWAKQTDMYRPRIESPDSPTGLERLVAAGKEWENLWMERSKFDQRGFSLQYAGPYHAEPYGLSYPSSIRLNFPDADSNAPAKVTLLMNAVPQNLAQAKRIVTIAEALQSHGKLTQLSLPIHASPDELESTLKAAAKKYNIKLSSHGEPQHYADATWVAPSTTPKTINTTTHRSI